MSTGNYFISDLHMFSRRSQAENHESEILAVAQTAKTIVLGGDMFDFRWSTLPSVEATVGAAIEWLKRLIEPHSTCDFHYVLGNHDYNRKFIDRLAEYAADQPHLSWHRYFVRLGQSVFLHGDVADGKMTPDMLAATRAGWLEDETRHRFRHWLYDVAINANVHKAASRLVHRADRIADRILHYLEHIGEGPENGVRHVYFGHTHAAMSNFDYGGLKFHNGGAPMKRLEFRIVAAEI